jgi:hypothetical protein
MKSFSFFFSLTLLFIVSGTLYAQKQNKDVKSGARFNFEKFQFSTQGLYKEIKQFDIKAIRLSFREFPDTVPVNSFLFNPKIREDDRISLIDLLLWAAEKQNLIVYEFYDTDFFSNPIPGDAIKFYLKSYQDVLTAGDVWPDYDASRNDNKIHQGVISYLLMEATIYNKNNNIIDIRPIGLCPILSSLNEIAGRIERRPFFWVYFPDIMPLLSNHIPEVKLKGVKTTLDFFIKNLYMGEYRPGFHTNSYFLDSRIWGDTTRFVEGFDVSWIYDRIKDGIFINPYNKLYQGRGKQALPGHSEISDEKKLYPDSVACAKYVYKTINLREVENYPLYFPEKPYLGQKSLIDVILNGIKDDKYIVYQAYEDSIPMSLEEVERVMGKEALVPYTEERILKDSVIMTDFTSSEVKKYKIKEAEFFDEKGNLIDSKILGISPIREFTDETTGRSVVNRELFFVPYNSEFKKILSENDAYRFTTNDNLSFLSFFQNKKYRAELFETQPASLATALKEFGIQPVEIISGPPFAPDISLKAGEQPKVVFREILRTDTANYQLFKPEYTINGLKDFFEFTMLCIEKGDALSYQYNPEGEFISELNPEEVKRITKSFDDTSIVTNPETGIDYFIVHSPEKPLINKYIFKELHTGIAVQIIGVCPVQEDYTSVDNEQQTPKLINIFCTSFNKTFREALAKQEICRMNCESAKTFGEYFAKNCYKGKIIKEEDLTETEAKKIIEEFKK